jgi:hypothetical protein
VPRFVTLVVGAVAILLLVAAPAEAQKPDAREVKARELFAVGRYQEALQIYGKLFAETAHPTYLRNIGRCYQNLGDPDKAISSFREYLRQARDVPADQRAQVEGYIREMEDLKRKREASTAPPSIAPPPPAIANPPPGAVPPPKVAALPPLSPPPAMTGGSPGGAPLVEVSAPASPPPPSAPGRGRHITAIVVGSVAAAALITGAAFGVRAFSKHGQSDDMCPKVDGVEQCTVRGVELNEQAKTAARVSDIAFGAGLVGAAVATYLFVTW